MKITLKADISINATVEVNPQVEELIKKTIIAGRPVLSDRQKESIAQYISSIMNIPAESISFKNEDCEVLESNGKCI